MPHTCCATVFIQNVQNRKSLETKARLAVARDWGQETGAVTANERVQASFWGEDSLLEPDRRAGYTTAGMH